MTTPLRLWPLRFSLRTLLVLITVVCVYLGWAMNWVRQRQAFLDQSNVHPMSSDDWRAEAPMVLQILGEQGIPKLILVKPEPGVEEAAKRLFPEADVSVTTFLCGR